MKITLSNPFSILRKKPKSSTMSSKPDDVDPFANGSSAAGQKHDATDDVPLDTRNDPNKERELADREANLKRRELGNIIMVSKKHEQFWYTDGTTSMQKILAGPPVTTCPKNLRVSKYHTRAFNKYFDDYNHQLYSNCIKGCYRGALKGWRGMSVVERKNRIRKAKQEALNSGIFFWWEIQSKRRSVRFRKKLVEHVKDPDRHQENLKKLTKIQEEYDLMVQTVRLILIDKKAEATVALRWAPDNCMFALSNQTSNADEIAIKRIIPKKKRTTLTAFLERDSDESDSD